MSQHRRHQATLIAALGVALTLLAACGAPGPAAPADEGGREAAATASAAPPAPQHEVQVELAVRDFALRAVDASCAAARPYLDLHPSATLSVHAADGSTVADAELPQGRAIKATDMDFGTAQREPTFCVFALSLPGLPPGDYELRGGKDRVIPFTVPQTGGEPVPVSFPPIAPGGPVSTDDASQTKES